MSLIPRLRPRKFLPPLPRAIAPVVSGLICKAHAATRPSMAIGHATIPTKAVYQHDETLRTHGTHVVAIGHASGLNDEERMLFKSAYPTDDSHFHVVVTAETIFYAQGGGQPSDTGIMTSASSGSLFHVDTVRSAPDGRILHLGRFESPEFLFEAGQYR